MLDAKPSAFERELKRSADESANVLHLVVKACPQNVVRR
jgi:hypothetical protein